MNYNTLKEIHLKDNKNVKDDFFNFLTTQKHILYDLPVLLPKINLTGTKCTDLAINLINKNREDVEKLINSTQDVAAIIVANTTHKYLDLDYIANNFITNKNIEVLLICCENREYKIKSENIKLITKIIEQSPTIRKIKIVDTGNLMPEEGRKKIEKTMKEKKPHNLFKLHSMFDINIQQATTEASVPSVGILKEKNKPDCLILLLEFDNKIQKMYWHCEKKEWIDFSKKPVSSEKSNIEWISIDKEQVLKIHNAIHDQPDAAPADILNKVMEKKVFKHN